ncbi:L-serine ammonia-lyase, iron-sulfur-dependent, subunit alpha [Treponema zioleckii]|uniref:L-serine ammonia-lyase, iron-sulfur-dependent, subunit alpha n=1 Tax=Treponema zioleckii TaxID=331680 RepID=UPI00168BEB37|nr:L-serine ammonia-lyase, iron-sulfur-dependent, subunit alpha [Treponema zioleckii]
MAFESMKAWCSLSEEKQASLFETLLADDCSESGMTREASLEKMTHLWNVMKETASGYDRDLRSQSFLSGGDAEKYRIYKEGGGALIGPFVSSVMYYALSTAESNACMRRIVASPTAGSCGILPAVLIPYAERFKTDDSKIIEALYVAAGIGSVIACRASISGAECGCQAEIGAASAMASGALVYLQGGSCKQVCNAVAIALKSLLGLVCDPVAGLVEVPCIKRNVIGAVNAVTSADMALSGIESRIPADEVIDAMKSVGKALPETLRETALGGLAATPTGKAIAEKLSKLTS